MLVKGKQFLTFYKTPGRHVTHIVKYDKSPVGDGGKKNSM